MGFGREVLESSLPVQTPLGFGNLTDLPSGGVDIATSPPLPPWGDYLIRSFIISFIHSVTNVLLTYYMLNTVPDAGNALQAKQMWPPPSSLCFKREERQ